MSTIIKTLLDPTYKNFEIKSPVPFLFRHNQSAFQQWSNKAEFFLNSKNQRIAQINKALHSVNLLKSTEKRLNIQLQAETQYLSEIENLLKEFEFKTNLISTAEILNHRIPSGQHFESYTKNIFRDWSWGQSENAVYQSFLKKINIKEGRALVVGGGAGRIAYDLAQLFPQLQIVQIDVNPLLSIVAKKICSGQTVELTEVAPLALTQDKISITHRLKAEAALNEGQVEFILGDISDHPFQDQIFDVIICPWVIDIVAEPFTDLAKRLNFLLKPEGELLIFGPLSFEKQNMAHRYMSEDLLECLIESGFGSLTQETQFVAYLQSPLDVQKREEHIICVKAQKIKGTKRPKSHSQYPEWLRDITALPPANSQYIFNLQSQKNLEAQFLAGLLNGKSLLEMATMLTKSGTGMTQEQSENYVVGVFAKLYEAGEITEYQ
ncbi:MAG: class I SAM-dependent methyltransferase [Bdellovibrionota bacterium]